MTEVISWDEWEKRKALYAASEEARANPPRSAAAFCQGVLVPSLYPKMGESPSPYGIDGYSTGGRGGPEQASWARFAIGAEEFTVYVERTTPNRR